MKNKAKKSRKEKPENKILIEKKIEEESYTDSHANAVDDAEPDYPFEDQDQNMPDDNTGKRNQ